MKPVLYAITLSGLLGLATIETSAWAQQPQEEEAAPSGDDIKAAAESFDLGRRAFKAKDYVEAAEHFESADARAPSAPALELAFRSREKANQIDRAATLAALAKQRHPDADFVKKLVPPVLKRAATELHEVTVKCDLPCEIVVQTKIIHGRPEAERTIFLLPGQHTVRAGWSAGRNQKQNVEATAGGKSELSFTAPPEPKQEAAPAPTPAAAAPQPTTTEPAPRDRGVEKTGGLPPIVFFIGAGVTGALGIATIWSGIDTVNNPGEDAVRDGCIGQGESCELYQDGRSAQTRTNVLAAVTAGVGVATLVIGAFATDWSGGGGSSAEVGGKKKAVSRGPKLEPWLGVGNGVTLGGASGRF